MTEAVAFEDYGFTYAAGAHSALTGVSLSVPGGRVVSVMAGQGAGKTTLLRAVAGLLGEVYQGATIGAVRRTSSARPGAFFDGYVQITLAVETVRDEIGLPL